METETEIAVQGIIKALRYAAQRQRELELLRAMWDACPLIQPQLNYKPESTHQTIANAFNELAASIPHHIQTQSIRKLA